MMYVNKKLEEGGFSMYKRYLDEREENKANDEAEKFERMQQIMKDATINDDPRQYQGYSLNEPRQRIQLSIWVPAMAKL